MMNVVKNIWTSPSQSLVVECSLSEVNDAHCDILVRVYQPGHPGNFATIGLGAARSKNFKFRFAADAYAHGFLQLEPTVRHGQAYVSVLASLYFEGVSGKTEHHIERIATFSARRAGAPADARDPDPAPAPHAPAPDTPAPDTPAPDTPAPDAPSLLRRLRPLSLCRHGASELPRVAQQARATLA